MWSLACCFFSLVTYQQLLRLNNKDTNFFALYSLFIPCLFLLWLHYFFFLSISLNHFFFFKESLSELNFLRVCTSKNVFTSPPHWNVSLDAFRVSSLKFWGVLALPVATPPFRFQSPLVIRQGPGALASSLCTPPTKHNTVIILLYLIAHV